MGVNKMFTPDFWKEANKIGNALYRINQLQDKKFCEVDTFYTFLVELFPENIENIQQIFLEYAEHAEERTRLDELNKALNQNQGMKKEIKYKVLEAQL